MNKMIVDNVVKPLSRRVGTAFAAMLGGALALDPSQLAQVENVAVMLLLVGCDLGLSAYERRGR